jgi:hypothetical protein
MTGSIGKRNGAKKGAKAPVQKARCNEACKALNSRVRNGDFWPVRKVKVLDRANLSLSGSRSQEYRASTESQGPPLNWLSAVPSEPCVRCSRSVGTRETG